ncbi:NADPH quinone oxidoreductase/ARE-binding protein [Schizosaccharomyces pombe]|uniref:Zeta-crystallin n=1 Tax=Schizosaccharomyces pombe (strain 972 / ATCC 24843) TaxID=284812 RepID=QOR_SCHPO|nr:putative NADPH quinone oxidoreductase/ARE-binding protein [Schizosaccharomyces pombe]O74489.2 RecName: Full=Probable quinone oxidoreductase; AltName: Full=NADPH:quinone reductase [Schizosaccharomyces pombe 972h-]CAA21450.1 NADPH quinone oxidoreductase/ARE-binding protein (predicted) [Schizosaccharomyces pombe]|eukprot:NP_588330.1 putative NADPH quinone oxidoreductase/ARE-binding protein [Schizosaccharomyces pombe]
MSNLLVQVSKTGPSSVLQVITKEIPKPAPNGLVIKNAYAGLNYIDTYLRTGLYTAPLPYIPGKEAAGVVAAVGDKVEADFKVGDRVVYLTPFGAYAQYTNVPTTLVSKVSEKIPLKIASAALLQGLTAYTLIEEAYPVKTGDTVVVHAAAGGVGLLLCQMLRARNVHVIATASTAAKRRIAIKNGAEIACSYEDLTKVVADYTNGKGVDAAYDSVGIDTLSSSLDALRNGGTMVSFGNASGAIDAIPLKFLSARCLKFVRPSLFGYITGHAVFEGYVSRLWKEILDNNLNIAIHHIFKLSEAKEAHDAIESRATTGKLLLLCNEDLADA